MLFSNEDVANLVNEHFEPVWQSLRPVPLVTIDFQNGHVVKRTLQGNVATLVCSYDGQVLDILPGIYSAEGYLQQLQRLQDLSILNSKQSSPQTRSTYLTGYYRPSEQSVLRDAEAPTFEQPKSHENVLFALGRGLMAALSGNRAETRDNATRAKSLVNRSTSRSAVSDSMRLMSKAATQMPLKAAINPAYSRPSYEADTSPKSVPNLSSTETSQWVALINDTLVNERLRKEMIHKKLRMSQPLNPESITKWLYRDVLDTDLDDPYLGLGKQLFDTYPFDE